MSKWAYWDGVRKFVEAKHDYLQGQIGNPEGEDAPNKKYYDPRVWTRKAEESMAERCGVASSKLGCTGTYPARKPASGSLKMLEGFLFAPRGNPLQGAIEKIGELVCGEKK